MVQEPYIETVTVFLCYDNYNQNASEIFGISYPQSEKHRSDLSVLIFSSVHSREFFIWDHENMYRQQYSFF